MNNLLDYVRKYVPRNLLEHLMCIVISEIIITILAIPIFFYVGKWDFVFVFLKSLLVLFVIVLVIIQLICSDGFSIIINKYNRFLDRLYSKKENEENKKYTENLNIIIKSSCAGCKYLHQEKIYSLGDVSSTWRCIRYNKILAEHTVSLPYCIIRLPECDKISYFG